MAKNKKPRKAYKPRIETKEERMSKPPDIFQIRHTFEPITRFINDLKTGEIMVLSCEDEKYNGMPVMHEWGGELMDVVPPLEGWIECWERISEGEGLGIDFAPFWEMFHKIKDSEEIALTLVAQVELINFACMQFYAKAPRKLLTGYSITAQIACAQELLESSEDEVEVV